MHQTPKKARKKPTSIRYSIFFSFLALAGFLAMYLFPMLREPETYEKVKLEKAKALGLQEIVRQDVKGVLTVGWAKIRPGFSKNTYAVVLIVGVIYAFALFIILKLPYSALRISTVVVLTTLCFVWAGHVTGYHISSYFVGGFYGAILAWADHSWRYTFVFEQKVKELKGDNAVQILDIFQRATQRWVWLAVAMFVAFLLPLISSVIKIIEDLKDKKGYQPVFTLLLQHIIIMTIILSIALFVGVVLAFARRSRIVDQVLFRLGKNCD